MELTHTGIGKPLTSSASANAKTLTTNDFVEIQEWIYICYFSKAIDFWYIQFGLSGLPVCAFIL